eukprot:3467328-Prymnesium_polylepis.2
MSSPPRVSASRGATRGHVRSCAVMRGHTHAAAPSVALPRRLPPWPRHGVAKAQGCPPKGWAAPRCRLSYSGRLPEA